MKEKKQYTCGKKCRNRIDYLLHESCFQSSVIKCNTPDKKECAIECYEKPKIEIFPVSQSLDIKKQTGQEKESEQSEKAEFPDQGFFRSLQYFEQKIPVIANFDPAVKYSTVQVGIQHAHRNNIV
jgi:hypothetical protein